MYQQTYSLNLFSSYWTRITKTTLALTNLFHNSLNELIHFPLHVLSRTRYQPLHRLLQLRGRRTATPGGPHVLQQSLEPEVTWESCEFPPHALYVVEAHTDLREGGEDEGRGLEMCRSDRD